MGNIFWLQITRSIAPIWPLMRRRLKNSFFWDAVVPIFTSQERSIFLNRGFDPPHRIGGQPEALIRVKFLDRMHHAQIAGNQVRHKQA